MITKRMIALAAALLLSVPAYGVAQEVVDYLVEGMWDDPNDAVEYGNGVAMYIDDVELVELDVGYDERDWDKREEQLVEGHTVFTTLQLTAEFDERNGTLNASGFVRCDYVLDAEYSFFGIGSDPEDDVIPVPKRVDRVGAECNTGHSVIITPGAYNISRIRDSLPLMQSTGQRVPLETPDGQQADAEELVFTVIEYDEWKGWIERTYYAWKIPLFHSWMDEKGRDRNLWATMPVGRLLDNDTDEYLVLPSDQVWHE